MILRLRALGTHPLGGKLLKERTGRDLAVLVAQLRHILVAAAAADVAVADGGGLRRRGPLHLYHGRRGQLFAAIQRGSEQGQDLFHIAYDAVVAVLEDRRVTVLIDGHDGGGILDALKVLGCAGDAAGDVQIAVEECLQAVNGKVLHVRIRQTRKNRKDEQVPYKFMGGVLHRCVHERLYLRLGEVAPIHAFGRVDISRKGVERQTPVVPRNGNDVFQHNHVAPHGIGAAFLLRAQKILEIVDECEVEFL